MRDLKELNINEGGRPVNRPSPSDEVIRAYENQFENKLDSNHIKLLSYSNGGHPELDSFIPQNLDDSGYWGLDTFFHLSMDGDPLNIFQVSKTFRDIIGSKFVPIAQDPGGNIIFLNEKREVSIYILDEERTILVSEDFGSFIDSLTINPDFI